MKITNKLSLIILALANVLPACTQNIALKNDLTAINSKTNGNNIIDLSKVTGKVTGKSITVKINSSSFSTKASENGDITYKTPIDVKSYLVYLIKNASSPFPASGDPLNASNIVAGPFTINTDSRVSETITFNNLSDSSGNYYYAAVRAFSGSNATGTELIKKDNNGGSAWTGTTAGSPYFSRVAVSTGSGILINSLNQVSNTNSLSVTPYLLDAQGTKLEAHINLNGPYSLVKSYVVNICTDNTLPVTTAVGGFGPQNVNINSSYELTNKKETISISNMPIGIYYVTIKAFSGSNGTGVNLTQPGNGGTYSPNDTSLPIAVSTSSANINSSQIVTFAPSTSRFFDISVNLIPDNINTIAGTGNNCATPTGSCGDTGTATGSFLTSPTAIAFDKSRNIYIADTNNNKIRKINSKTGVISTVAGTGTAGVTFTGIATTTDLNAPEGIAIDNNNNLFISDTGNNRIKEVNLSTGSIANIAGTGSPGYSTGMATNAQLNGPTGIAADNLSNVYFSDTNNHLIRQFQIGGFIANIAGSGLQGYNGDGQPATSTNVKLNKPKGLLIDSSNSVYFADTGNNVIRMFPTSGNISTIAGTGTQSYTGDGSYATSATLFSPESIAMDSSGNILVADTNNHVIRRFSIGGNIITVAGNSVPCSTSTNPCGDLDQATSSNLKTPKAVLADKSGNIYISDTGNNRLRKVFVNN